MQDAEAAAGITILLIVIAVAAFWCALPGIICGYILKSSGRSFAWGFVLGIVFGPLGLLISIIFALIGKPQSPQITARHSQSARHEGEFFDPPMATSRDPLPWSVAVFACFVAAGLIGGFIYFYTRGGNEQIKASVSPAAPTPVLRTNLLPSAPAQPTPQALVLTMTPIPTPTSTPTPSPSATPTPEASPSPSPSPVFAKWTSRNALEAFKAAGLDLGTPETVDLNKLRDSVVPLTMKEGTHFDLPSLCPDCGGRVYSFASQSDLEQVRRYYVNLGKVNHALFSWVFVKDNLLVQLNGQLPQESAMKYDEALASIK